MPGTVVTLIGNIPAEPPIKEKKERRKPHRSSLGPAHEENIYKKVYNNVRRISMELKDKPPEKPLAKQNLLYDLLCDIPGTNILPVFFIACNPRSV